MTDLSPTQIATLRALNRRGWVYASDLPCTVSTIQALLKRDLIYTYGGVYGEVRLRPVIEQLLNLLPEAPTP